MLRFRRLGSSRLYQGEPLDSSGGHLGEVLFIVPAQTPLPASVLSLEEAWAFQHPSLGAGYLLFLENRPGDTPVGGLSADQIEAFAARLHSLLPGVVRNQHLSLGWVRGIPTVPSTVSLQTLNMVRGEGTFGEEIRTQNIPQALRFQQVEVMVLPATPFGLGGPGFVLENTEYIAPPGADPRMDQPTKRRVYLRGAAAYDIDKVGEQIEIPLMGAGRGSLQFDVGGLNAADLDAGKLDAALYYVVPEPALGRDQSLRYPIFNLASPGGSAGPTTEVGVRARLYPANPLQSIFELGSQNGADSPVIQSYFATYHGHPIHLIPQAGAGLMFTEVPNPGVYPSRSAEVRTHYSLTPVGNYEMTVDNPGTDLEWLRGGSSGSEFISFQPKGPAGRGDVLVFFRNQKGYAPEFDQLTTHLQQVDSDLLSDKFTTSWLTVGHHPLGPNGHQNQYYAQPDDNVLHTQTTNEFLQSVEVAAADLPTLNHDGGDVWAAFPMTPLNGVVAPDERISPPIRMEKFVIFEKEIMSPYRKNRISSVKTNSIATNNGRSLLQGPINAVTPQGMLVQVDGNDWGQLTLAKDSADVPNYLRFGDITDTFQDALQTNRLFLVASQNGVLDAGTTQDKVEITAWPFRLQVGQNPHGLPAGTGLHRFNNVVIFKFIDETFEDLIEDSRRWARPDSFNSSTSDIQTWLLEFIEDAKAKAADSATADLYSPLVDNVLNNAAWTGVLALNVTVPVNEMPCEVQGLLGGIRKLAEFKAHHLGFEISKVNTAGTDIERSSIFALIDYEDNDGPTVRDPAPDYEFLVKTLKVRFANTEIADFTSAISITMKKAFDEKIKDPLANPEKVIIDTLELEGSYQNFNGTPTYTFELVAVNNPFEFGGSDDSLSLIHQMTVTKVQFATDTCVDVSMDPATARISAKFSYWGYLNFRSGVALDFFSFDKLVFSGLVLKMSFGFNADGTPSSPAISPAFEFDPSNLNISVSVSGARKDSLLANFPLRVNSFHYAPAGVNVSHLGYLEIPNLVPGWGAASINPDAKPRYGLSFTIDMGPLTSLMKSKKKPKGAIEIIATWFAEDEGAGVIFGVKLGAGSDGTKEFGIEGVLTLAVDNFGFLKIPETPGPGEDYVYAFFIKNAFLKVINTQVPPGGDFSMMLFVPYSGESDQVNLSNIGWYVAYDTSGGASSSGGSGGPAPRDAEVVSISVMPSTPAAYTDVTIRVVVKATSTAIVNQETVIVTVQAEGVEGTTSRPFAPTPLRREVTLTPGVDSPPQVFTWPAKLPGKYQFTAKADLVGDLTPGNNSKESAVVTVTGSGKKEKRSIVKLDFLGIGNKIELATPDQEFRTLNTVEAVIDVMKTGLLPSQPGGPALAEQLQKIYKPDNGILIGFDVTILDVVRIAFLFAQTNEVYGALIGFVDKAPAKLKGFQFQILYKKITDDIGVYQMVLKLPDVIRQFELGAASITLPLIAIDIYTNGNFKLDFGFPYNANFSRSAGLQMMAGPIPIVGYAGFYFAYLSGATSTTVPALRADTPDRWDPVLEFGIGLKLGIGKHIEKGPLRAGVSISIQVILEGALAWYQDAGSEASTLGDPPDWYRVKGLAGLVAQLYGVVDFGIVKLGIEVNASANFTFVFESYKDIELGVILSVSVRVSVVIGSFKIFGKTVRIEISFSFSATFSFAFTVANPQGTVPPASWDLLSNPIGSSALARPMAALQQTDLEPIVWDPLDVHGAARRDLHLTFYPQVTVADDNGAQRAHAVAGLTIGAGDNSEFNDLLRAVMIWAIKLHTTSTSIDLATLEELDARLHVPRTLATSAGNSTKPLNYAQIRDFLTTNFNPLVIQPVEIDEDNDPAPADATVFPMIPELTLNVTGQLGGDFSVDFWHHNLRDEEYQLDVADYFDELLVDVEYKSGIFVQSARLQSHGADEASMATLVLQDYFAFLVKTGIDRAIEYARKELDGESEDLTTMLDKLEDRGDFTTISSMAARFFFNGMRIPPVFDSEDNVALSESALPLYELTGQQVPILLIDAEFDDDDNETSPAVAWTISLSANSGAETLVDFSGGAAELTIPAEDDDKTGNSRGNVGELENLTPSVGGDVTVVQLPSLKSMDRQFSFKNPTHVQNTAGGQVTTLYPLADVLLDRLTDRGSLNVKLHNTGEGDGGAATDPTPLADWALRVNFSAKRVQRSIDGTGQLLDNTYLLAGTNERARNLVGRIIEDAQSGAPQMSISGLQLFYEIEGKDDALVGDTLGAGSSVILMKTNLSTVSAPQGVTNLLSHTPDDSDYAVTMGAGHDVDFLRLLWEASITNAPGYYLYYNNGSGGDETGLPEDVFQGGANQANLTLVVTFTSINSACDTLLINGSSFVEGDFYVTAEHELDWHSDIAPGAVAFEMTRPNPQKPGFTGGHATVALEPLFNLLSYNVEGDAGFRESIKGLPVGPTTDDPDDPDLPDNWTYRQGIKVAPYALQNVGTPDVRPNMYAGAGSVITLGFQFLDIFGNEMPGPALDARALNVFYTDAIKGVGQWPSLSTGYKFQATDGQLLVTLHFTADDYIPVGTDSTEVKEAKERRLANALETYLQIKEQLHGPHVAAMLTTSVAPAKEVSVLADLQTFVTSIISFLDSPATVAAPVDKQLTMAISGTDRAQQTDNTFAVVVHIDLERSQGVDPTALEVGQNGQQNKPEVARVLTSVPPESTAGFVPENATEMTQEMALTAFAEDFESAFTDLKVATGLGEDGPQTIWAVRLGGSGITVSPPGAPYYFAPAPLSNVLLARSDVSLHLNGPGEDPTTESFSDIDLDVWGREFLAAVDRFLLADLAVTARQVNPAGYLKVIQAKETLADGIAAGVTNVLEQGLTGTDLDAYVAAAREAYEQSLLTRLSTAYDIETAVVHAVQTSNSDVTDTIAPRLYGPVTGALVDGADEATSSGFTFSTAKIDLDNSGGPKFVYLFNAERAREHASAHVNVTYNVTHVEHDIQPAIGGYQASSWLTLLLPDEPINVGVADIPIALREYPVPPALIGQKALPDDPDGVITVQNATLWQYLYTYQQQAVAQDSIFANIRFNVGHNVLANPLGDPEPDLFDWLARFHREYPQLQGNLDLLVKGYPVLAPGGSLTGEGTNASNAVSWFADLVHGVASTWKTWVEQASGNRNLLQALEEYEWEFEVIERNDPGQGRIEMIRTALSEPDAQFPDIDLVLEDGVTHSTLTPSQNGGFAQYAYPWGQDALPETRELTFIFDELDALSTENAWGGIHLLRNLNLSAGIANPPTTNPRFVYQTPQVRFVNKVTPLIDNKQPIEISNGQVRPLGGGNGHIAALLNELFESAVSASDTRDRLLKVGVRYAYDVRGQGGPAIGPGQTDEFQAYMPVTQVMPHTLNPNDMGGFIDGLTSAMDAWMNSTNPVRARGFYEFDLSIFAALSATDLPVVRLRRLWLGLDKIS